ALTNKVLRAGYYWPSMGQDAKDFVRKCEKCQIHGDMHNAPPTEMSSITTPWPFMRWGMDLIGPFKTAPGQLKYLIVAVDYCTKWVEAEALAKITATN
ncbi:protein NYNRIN-like, partial [Trifolium medium]|nr:protein NYNRIN-like [Trifolium medium]